MNHSKEFERFHFSCFDQSQGAVRDGFDVEAALALSGDERAEAESMILEALQVTEDSRPLIAAGVMQLCEAAPTLKRRISSGFRRGRSDLLVHAALALYQIEKWSEAGAVIVGILETTPKTLDQQWTRMMAVEALESFTDDSRCHAVLFTTVEDEDNFIGFLAIKSLKSIFIHNSHVRTLLATLQETQVTPNRWMPQFLELRKSVVHDLELATGIRMPSVAMEKIIPQDHQQGGQTEFGF